MNKKILILVLGIVLVAIIIAAVLFQIRNQGTGTITPTTTTEKTIRIWGLWDDPAVYTDLFKDYETANPGVKIEYAQKKFSNTVREKVGTLTYVYKGDYMAEVQQKIKDKQVDIVRLHQSALPQMQSLLTPAPQSLLTGTQVKQDYYPAIYEAVTTVNNQVYALPNGIDGLVMFYNKDLFSKEKISVPPTNWDDLKTIAKKLTKTTNGVVTQAGVNLGSGSNLADPFESILLAMTQSNIEVVGTIPGTTKTGAVFANDPVSVAAANLILDFTRTQKTWSPRTQDDIKMFADGKLAILIAPSWRANEILQKNKTINFDMAPLPIIPNANKETPQYLASYWVDAVASGSKVSTDAWKLLIWLNQPEQLRRIYTNQKKFRLFGSVYPRPAMAKDLENDPYVTSILKMAPQMKAWSLYDYGEWERVFTQAAITWEDRTEPLTQENIKSVQDDINSSVFNIK